MYVINKIETIKFYCTAFLNIFLFNSAPEQLYNDFNMSQMAFNPPIPVPKSVQPKPKASIDFVDMNFEEECNNILKNSVHKPFYIECSKIKV